MQGEAGAISEQKQAPGTERPYEQGDIENPENPGRAEQNPGTSRQEEDISDRGEYGQGSDNGGTGITDQGHAGGTTTGISEQGRGEPSPTVDNPAKNDDAAVRNPSGDDISEGVEGDEGTGRGF